SPISSTAGAGSYRSRGRSPSSPCSKAACRATARITRRWRAIRWPERSARHRPHRHAGLAFLAADRRAHALQFLDPLAMRVGQVAPLERGFAHRPPAEPGPGRLILLADDPVRIPLAAFGRRVGAFEAGHLGGRRAAHRHHHEHGADQFPHFTLYLALSARPTTNSSSSGPPIGRRGPTRKGEPNGCGSPSRALGSFGLPDADALFRRDVEFRLRTDLE